MEGQRRSATGVGGGKEERHETGEEQRIGANGDGWERQEGGTRDKGVSERGSAIGDWEG